MPHKFNVGDAVWIHVCPELRQLAEIAKILSDVDGGYKIDRELDGIKFWNEDVMTAAKEK